MSTVKGRPAYARLPVSKIVAAPGHYATEGLSVVPMVARPGGGKLCRNDSAIHQSTPDATALLLLD